MGDRRSDHLSDEELARLQRGSARHLAKCPECASRLRDLQAADAAYAEYRDSLRGPALPPAPKAWRSLDALISEGALSEEGKAWSGAGAWRWWLIPGLATALCLLIATVVVLRRSTTQVSGQASELLTRSASAELPPNRLISMRVRGRILVRPAVLVATDEAERDPDLAHLQMMFHTANYSWREPLSARSFQVWRRGLRDKRDTVSVIHAGGEAQFYRVQTDTGDGVLHRVSLTLRGKELRPANGTFQFEGESPLEMGENPPIVPPAVRREPPASVTPSGEAPASPGDTLHVLAALDELGADAGEPVEVTEDAGHQHVVVRASGLTPERQRQIALALQSLPRITLDLDSGNAPSSLPVRPAGPERYSASIPGSFKQQLEDKIGGAVTLQEVSDRVLEASASILGRVHAVQVLAEKFPPDIEAGLTAPDRDLLRKLRQRHAIRLQQLAANIRTELKPLLPVPAHGQPPATLAASARDLDGLLNRLLAGSFSQSGGEEMLRSLGPKLESFESAVVSQAVGGR
jgi:hypothetical protein